MSKEDKTILDKLFTNINIIDIKLKNAVFIKQYPTSKLVIGEEFNSKLKNIGATATSIIFTKTPIPVDKIPEGIIVSTDDSEVKSYVYIDNDIIYISPEEKDTIIYANENCSNMFYNCKSLTYLDLSNFNTSNVTDMSEMFRACSKLLSIIGLENFDTSKVTNMSWMFYQCYVLSNININNFNTSNVTDMHNMFGMINIGTVSIDISNFDTSKVTDMSYMFYSCNNLKTLDLSNFDINNVTDMSGMFNGCRLLVSIKGLENWNTSKVITMSEMFKYTKLNDIKFLKSWDTSNVTDMSNMFSYCRDLVDLSGIENFNTSRVTDMMSMFSDTGITHLNYLHSWNTSNVIFIKNMFGYCSNLSNISGIENWDTSKVTNMDMLFRNCTSLTDIHLSDWDTSKVTSMYGIFDSCDSLMTLEISRIDTSFNIHQWDTSKVTDMRRMFYNCSNLENIIGNINLTSLSKMGNMFYNCNSLIWEITIRNPNITDYVNVFNECSTRSGASFRVDYTPECKTIANTIVNTKSEGCNVILGFEV